MSIFSFLGGIFKPAADLVDNLHDSKEEMGHISNTKAELKNKLAEIEANVATRMLELQSQIIEANSKVAMSEQEHGNFLSKSWRPISSLVFVILLVLMGVEVIPFNQFLAGVAGSFLGIYAPLRSLVDKKK